MKVGTRLRSQVCTTQVVVVRSGDGLDDLRCGGAPMIGLDASADGDTALDPEFADGTILGKRYVTASGGELLATKGGDGTLTIGGVALQLKEVKPLPASD